MGWKAIAWTFAICFMLRTVCYCSEVILNSALEIIDRVNAAEEKEKEEEKDKELMKITKHMFN